MVMDNILPEEKLLDGLSRQDELLVVQIGLLRSIAQRIGLQVPGDGGGSGTPVPVSEKATRLLVATLPLGAADTEVTWQFPVGMKTFAMHSRNGNAVRMSSQQGIVAGSNEPYFTLNAGTAYTQDDLNIAQVQPAATFYFACSIANEVLEIIVGV